MMLSAVLKEGGHECDIFIRERDDEELVKSVHNSSPDIVAFSTTTGAHIWALKVAKRIKERVNVPILFGGPHPTFFPQVLENEAVDMICIGEGEHAILELADNLECGKEITKIKNLWIKRNGKIYRNDLRLLIENLDELPFADRELYYKYDFLRTNPNKPFITGRGCPYSCSFCFNATLRNMYSGKGRYVRRRSVDNVIEEIRQVKAAYGIGTVRFSDDTFILNPKWLDEFFKKYRAEIGNPYYCVIRADLVNEKIIRGLKQSGCHSVSIGIETGNEYLRNAVLKKGITNEQIIKATKLLKKYGIKFGTFNMMGLPGETIETAFETVKLNINIGTDFPWCSVLQPYPKTEITRYAREGGYINDIDLDVDSFDFTYFDKGILKQENINELTNLQKLFFFAVKFPWLIPIIKLLIKLPPNKIFKMLFILGYGYKYRKANNIGILRLIKFGLKTGKLYI
jgi:radical SAM superfamily enzyme YgiQ (UPF0313 family)